MAVIRKYRNQEASYVAVPNAFIRRTDLRRGAKALLVELMSHSDGWNVTLEGLCTDADGKHRTREMLRELEGAKLLQRGQVRGEDGTFTGETEYLVSFQPFEPENPNSEHQKPMCDFPTSEKSDIGKSNDIRRKETTKKKSHYNAGEEKTEPVNREQLVADAMTSLGMSLSIVSQMKVSQTLDGPSDVVKAYLDQKVVDYAERDQKPSKSAAARWLMQDWPKFLSDWEARRRDPYTGKTLDSDERLKRTKTHELETPMVVKDVPAEWLGEPRDRALNYAVEALVELEGVHDYLRQKHPELELPPKSLTPTDLLETLRAAIDSWRDRN